MINLRDYAPSLEKHMTVKIFTCRKIEMKKVDFFLQFYSSN